VPIKIVLCHRGQGTHWPAIGGAGSCSRLLPRMVVAPQVVVGSHLAATSQLAQPPSHVALCPMEYQRRVASPYFGDELSHSRDDSRVIKVATMPIITSRTLERQLFRVR